MPYVCTFDPKRPRISAFEIKEWIYKQLRMPENTLNMVQLDGPGRQIFIKFVEFPYVPELLQSIMASLSTSTQMGKYHKFESKWPVWAQDG